MYTPYALNNSLKFALSIDSIIKLVADSSVKVRDDLKDESVFISSYKYISGSWSHIKSERIQIYEIEKNSDQNDIYFVLYNSNKPDKIIETPDVGGWEIIVIDSCYKILNKEKMLLPKFSYIEAMWDMIYTSLVVKNEDVEIKIMFAHTGGGGGREKEFTFQYKFDSVNKDLKFVKSEDTTEFLD